ncbi:MAG: translation elongation factor EF-1beta [Methanomassiliicoccaceae archaeon]|nr:translation elongation factor EF-1beta [Methanomassiliicoccaceae archaeon]MCL2146112.1 translation elongation factor EF-1beta [Methanomassiliicoccaceae archaeon]
MGQIVAVYDLMPESTEVDLESIIGTIAGVVPKGVQVLESKIMPVAFGLMKINVGFSIDDTDESVGGDLEKALSSISGIENIECVSSTLL